MNSEEMLNPPANPEAVAIAVADAPSARFGSPERRSNSPFLQVVLLFKVVLFGMLQVRSTQY